MGVGGISISSLLLILVIVMLVFGTKKLRNMGTDLGGAIKGFRKAMHDDDAAGGEKRDRIEETGKSGGDVIDAEAEREPERKDQS